MRSISSLAARADGGPPISIGGDQCALRSGGDRRCRPACNPLHLLVLVLTLAFAAG